MPAPQIVATYSSDFSTAATSKTVTVNYEAGDSLVVIATGSAAMSMGSVSASGISWTNSGTTNNNNVTYGVASLYYALKLTTSATDKVITQNESGGTKPWGFMCFVVKNLSRIQRLASTNGSGAPNPTFSPSSPRCLILSVVNDVSGSDGGSRVWRNFVQGPPTQANGRELLYSYVPGVLTTYAAYDTTASTATVSYGMSEPNTMTYTNIFYELTGDDAPRRVVLATSASATGTSVSTNFTITNSINSLLVAAVAVGVQPANGTDTGITAAMTYNGVPMTSIVKVHSNAGSQGFLEVFYLLNPSSDASYTLQATASSSADLSIQASSLYNCNHANPISDIQTVTGSGTNPELSATSNSSRDCYLSFVASGGSVTAISSLSSGVANYSAQNFNTSSNAGNLGHGLLTFPSPTATMRWTITSSPYAMVMIRLNPASYFQPQTVSGYIV